MTRLAIIVVLALVQAAAGQYLAPLGGGRLTGDGSAGFEMAYVAPQLHKWYGPRQLRETYAQPWYARDNFYARDGYRRYVDRLLEGAE